MVGQLGAGGFEPRTNPAERRDFFDLRRQIAEINARLAALETLTAPSTWTAVTFQNSWMDYGAGYQTVQYRKVGDIVYLRGLMRNGTLAAVAFTLPVGFRPPSATMQFGPGSGSNLYHDIQADGDVFPAGGTNTVVVLDCQFSVTA